MLFICFISPSRYLLQITRDLQLVPFVGTVLQSLSPKNAKEVKCGKITFFKIIIYFVYLFIFGVCVFVLEMIQHT